MCGNKHQNNHLVSAETVHHSSTYIILYVVHISLHAYAIFAWSELNSVIDYFACVLGIILNNT